MVEFLAARFLGLDDDRRAIVEFSGGRVPAYVLAGVPQLNDTVWVQVLDGVAFVHGPTVPKPDEGGILTASGGSAVVQTDIGDINASYDNGLLLLDPGDIVHLVWGPSGAWIDGIKVAYTPPAPPPPPITTPTVRTVEFGPIDSGSFQSGYGWRTNEVWSSASNQGGWFYGPAFRDTIPDAAVVHGAQIYLPPPTRLLGAMPFGRHDWDYKPGGAMTVHSTSTLPGTSGWVNIPTGLIDHLKQNPGGLGFNYGGYNIWPGTQRDGMSGRVRVTFG